MGNGLKKTKEYTFITLLGAISGSFLGEILANYFTKVNFLGKSYFIGLQNPLVLDLKVLEITFGLGLNLNIMSIIGIILAIILYKKS